MVAFPISCFYLAWKQSKIKKSMCKSGKEQSVLKKTLSWKRVNQEFDYIWNKPNNVYLILLLFLYLYGDYGDYKYYTSKNNIVPDSIVQTDSNQAFFYTGYVLIIKITTLN